MKTKKQIAESARESIKAMFRAGNEKLGGDLYYQPSNEAIDAIIRVAIDEANAELQKEYDDLDKLYRETCQDYYNAKMESST